MVGMEYEKEIGLDKEGNQRAYINYQNPHKIYNFALEMHGKDRMSRPHTWVYNLSLERPKSLKRKENISCYGTKKNL